jgi:spore coat protein A
VPTALRGPGLANLRVADARVALTNAVLKQRHVTLVEIAGKAGPLVVMLNAVYWDEAVTMGQFREMPTVNSVEQWNIINLTADTHPIHLHLVQFLIKGRQNLQTQQYTKAYNATGPRTVMPGMVPPPAGGPTVPANYPPLDPTLYLQNALVPPAANEAGWKDTVQAPPGMVTSILVPFGAAAGGGYAPFGNNFTGRYAWHCHILDHEDNEMMLPFNVV